MPGRRHAAQPDPTNGFVASAARLPIRVVSSPSAAQAWMDQAWGYYNTVGQLRFVAVMLSNLVSRAELRIAVESGGSLVPVDDGPAVDALEQYFGGRAGHQEMLYKTALNMTISGEAYHVADGEDGWHVLASGKLVQRGAKILGDFGDGRGKREVDTFVARIWQPHPRDPAMADSPIRSNIGVLQEIVRLNEHIASQLDSRLSGPGLLLVPSEIQFAGHDGNADPASSSADTFLKALGEVMLTALRDRGSAAAQVPMVVTGPGEHLDKVKLLHFWSPLDAAVLEMRDSAIRQLALGLDVPPEALLGVAGSNHWTAWLIDDSTLKTHVEPRLAVITSAIATAYIRPSIKGMVEDPSKWHVIADTSAVRVRPDRSTQAIDLYDRGELSGAALRRETGFSEVDLPSQDEKRLWLLRKVATGVSTPEQTAAALELLGLPLLPVDPRREETRSIPDVVDRISQPLQPDEKRSRRRIERGLDGELADQASLIACSEVLVMRALERAGNRLVGGKQRTDQIMQIPVHERYLVASGSNDSLLEGAWGFAETILAAYTSNPAAVVSRLDMYVRGLLTAQVQHTREALTAALAGADAR